MNRPNEIGQVFHDLRTNRNIPLKQVADGTVSESQISRFERGESDLSVSRFLVALSNMKVELNEFADALQKYQRSETIEFMGKLVPLEYKRDVDGFKELFNEQKEKFEKNPSVYQYRLNMILVQSFICKCDPDIPFPEEYVAEVADYLFRVEEWKIYELILIGNLYLFIDIPVLHRMGQECLNKTIKTKTNKRLTLITLLNIFETCVYRKDLEVAGYYKDNLPKLLENETLLYEKNLYHFLSGLYLYHSGEKEQGLAIMKQAITIYEWLGCENLANNYRKDLDRFTK